MARIQSRPRTDGGVSHTVSWVIGGGRNGAGKTTASETFTERWRAEWFKDEVEKAGHHWPVNAAGWSWVKGHGFNEPTTDRHGRPTKITSDTCLHDIVLAWRDEQTLRVAGNHKSHGTADRQFRTYELHWQDFEIRPGIKISSVPFNLLTEGHMKAWLIEQLASGAQAKSISDRGRLMKSIIRYGQHTLALRPDNPMDRIDLPKPESKRDIRFFRRNEWALFRKCLAPDAQDICDFLLETGVRISEAFAIRIGDVRIIDEDEIIVDIRRTWTFRGKNDNSAIKTEEDETKVFKLAPPKNRKAREVTVVGATAQRIIELIGQRSDSEYVFATAKGKAWRYHLFYTNRWAPAIRLAAKHDFIKHVTPHMLRHSCAVWMLEGGRPIHEVSDILGHSNINITWQTYGGFTNRSGKREAARVMADAAANTDGQPKGPKPSEARIRKPGRPRANAPRLMAI